MISMIVAVAKNGVIGREGGLPWVIKSDLKRFKEITMGKPIVMGRKTWQSLPRRPLPGRQNIVITRAQNFIAEGAIVVSTFDEAIQKAGNVPEICIIGGGEIYRGFLPLADVIYLTTVDLDVDGNTKFPELTAIDWQEDSIEHHPIAEGDTAGFTLRKMVRQK